MDNIAKMTGKQLQDQRMDDMRELMVNEQGRRVIWEIMDSTGLMSRNPSFDPAIMNRNEGKRDLGVYLYDWVMEAAPMSFLKMLQTKLEQQEK